MAKISTSQNIQVTGRQQFELEIKNHEGHENNLKIKYMYFLKRYYKTRRDMTIPLETIQEKRFKEVNNSLREFFASLLSTLLSKHTLDYLT